MSLARTCARLALVEALKGKTLVGDNVRDSLIGAFDVNDDGTISSEEKKPFVAVYTEGGTVAEPMDMQARSLTANGEVVVMLEWGIATSMAETNKETGEQHIVAGLLATDDVFEFHNDLVGRQISTTITDPENPWAEAFRALAFRIVSIERRRAANIDDGIRLAGQQLAITVALIDDPLLGEPVPQPFAMFFDLAAGSDNADLVSKAVSLAGEIHGTDEAWINIRRRLGLTEVEAKALGFGLLEEPDEGAPDPELSEASVAIDGYGEKDIAGG